MLPVENWGKLRSELIWGCRDEGQDDLEAAGHSVHKEQDGR